MFEHPDTHTLPSCLEHPGTHTMSIYVNLTSEKQWFWASKRDQNWPCEGINLVDVKPILQRTEYLPERSLAASNVSNDKKT